VNPNGLPGAVADSSAMPQGISDPARQGGAKMYAWDTMDGSVKLAEGETDATTGTYVLHYSRYRTFVKTDEDYRRQLGFRNPPEDTVVTWNDTYVQRDSAYKPVHGDYFVLFLNGTVKKYDVKRIGQLLKDNGWPDREEIWRLKPY